MAETNTSAARPNQQPLEKPVNKIVSRASYMFGAFGHDVFYAAMSTYLIMFITKILFNRSGGSDDVVWIGAATTIIMGLRIVELFIDPFIGNIIDRTKTRWGHFRPWIVVGGSVASLALLALFSTLGDLSHENPELYLVIFAALYITMDVSFSFNDVAFWSMLPALSLDSREREKNATLARFGSGVGQNLTGAVVMPIVLFFSVTQTAENGDATGWFVFAALVCIINAISALCVGLGTREVADTIRENAQDTKLGGVFKVLFKNDQLLWIFISYLIYCTGFLLVNALLLYYYTYILGNEYGYSLLMLLNIFISLGSVALFPILSRIFTRKPLFFASVIVMIAGLCVLGIPVPDILGSGATLGFVLALIGGILFVAPQPMVFLIALMIITDSIEYGQLKLGHRDESVALSLRPLADKFGGAVSTGLVGIIVIACGMTNDATAETVTASDGSLFKVLMLLVPAVILVLAMVVFALKIKLTEKMHADIVAQLEETWGEHLEANIALNEKASKAEKPAKKKKRS